MRKNSCVFTVVNNEPDFFPVWLDYYSKHFDGEDIYVLDHRSDGDFLESLNILSSQGRINHIKIHWSKFFNHQWLRETVQNFQRFLFSSYEKTLFTEVDEIIVHRKVSLNSYIKNFQENVVRTKGYNVLQIIEKEKEIDKSFPILAQREYWYENPVFYNKPLLSKTPLVWCNGFHECVNMNAPVDHDLVLVHIHYVDWTWIHQRDIRRGPFWEKKDWDNDSGVQNKPKSVEGLMSMFRSFEKTNKIEKIDPVFKFAF